MIIVRLLSPEPFGWFGTTKVYSGMGADIVMESITLKTPSPQHTTALWGRTDGANLRYRLVTTVTFRDGNAVEEYARRDIAGHEDARGKLEIGEAYLQD
jgi:hypothetical protein